MKNLLLSFLVLILPKVHASPACSLWEASQGVSCSFLGEWTQVWSRKCESPCHMEGNHVMCELERICTNEDPNAFSRPCTSWKEEPRTTCANPGTQRFEQKWVRACTQNLSTVKCSDLDPNL